MFTLVSCVEVDGCTKRQYGDDTGYDCLGSFSGNQDDRSKRANHKACGLAKTVSITHVDSPLSTTVIDRWIHRSNVYLIQDGGLYQK